MDSHQPRRDLATELDKAINRLKQLEVENQNLRTKLYTDSLTGVWNRRLFDEKFPQLVELAQHTQEPLAMLVADIDGLKRTNDSLGHSKGDELLKAVASSLSQTARSTDLVGRLGGDEFYVLLPGFCALESQNGDELLEHTIQRYKTAFNHGLGSLNVPETLYVNVSFGLATLDSAETADTFYHRVDKIAQYNKRAFYDKLKKHGVSFSDERV